MIHTSALSGLGIAGQNITLSGKYGVDIFFVISGFTIAKTYLESASYKAYLTQRLFRILPLYWGVLIFAFAATTGSVDPNTPNGSAESTIGLYELTLNLFLVGYFDYPTVNSVLGVEWTIPIEVTWYIALPLLLPLLSRLKSLVPLILALAIFVVIAGYLSKAVYGTSAPIRFSPLAHGHWFFIGVFAYFARLRSNSKLFSSSLSLYAVSCTMVFILPISMSGKGEILAIGTAILIANVSNQKAPLICDFLSQKLFLFLGTISYSLYLLHPVAIGLLRQIGLQLDTKFLQFSVTLSVTIVLSVITYQLIEHPTNKLGRYVSKHLTSGKSLPA